ncbi:MAG TPA: DOMON-like domain-containing protein [Hyphomonadaceae bacterium]
MRHSLKLHPDSSSKAVKSVTVDVTRPHLSTLALHYVAEGDIAGVVIPPSTVSKRRDELWKHTCFEVFLRRPSGSSYAEFNFSPSTEYAGYGFTRYREGMIGALGTTPEVSSSSSPTRLELRASIWMGRLGEIDPEGELRLGVSAIIEEADGSKSYWALAHPQGKPDFHHADSFVLALPAEQT